MRAAAAALAGGPGLASAASAAPLAPVIAGPAHVTDAASGCGPGFASGRFTRCRPVGRRFFGPRCFVRPTPVGPRRICR
ncbi:hypothetical protein ACRAWG_07045 [Methylobacterium sp. P31]